MMEFNYQNSIKPFLQFVTSSLCRELFIIETLTQSARKLWFLEAIGVLSGLLVQFLQILMSHINYLQPVVHWCLLISCFVLILKSVLFFPSLIGNFLLFYTNLAYAYELLVLILVLHFPTFIASFSRSSSTQTTAHLSISVSTFPPCTYRWQWVQSGLGLSRPCFDRLYSLVMPNLLHEMY